MCWADAPHYRNPPQACSFYTLSNLSLGFEGLGLLHFAFERTFGGVDWGSLPKTDPKGTLSTDAHLPVGQRRCCRGRDAISSR